MDTTATTVFTRTVTPRSNSVTLPVPQSFVGKTFDVSFVPVEREVDPYAPDPEILRKFKGRKPSEILRGCWPPEVAADFNEHIRRSRNEWDT